MDTVTLDQASSGMCLAKDVKDFQGRVILKSGHTLTDADLSKLARWGVQDLPVQGEGGVLEAVGEQEKIDAINKRLLELEQQFAPHQNDELMLQFYTAEKKLLTDKLNGSG